VVRVPLFHHERNTAHRSRTREYLSRCRAKKPRPLGLLGNVTCYALSMSNDIAFASRFAPQADRDQPVKSIGPPAQSGNSIHEGGHKFSSAVAVPVLARGARQIL